MCPTRRWESTTGRRPSVPHLESIGSLSDDQGTVVDVVDNSGNILSSEQLDAFGNIVTQTNPSTLGRLGFQGGQIDIVTGFEHFGAREYNSATGRWDRLDPESFAAGQSNLYEFAGNEPTDWIRVVWTMLPRSERNGRVDWAIQKQGTFYNSVTRWVYLGQRDGDNVPIDNPELGEANGKTASLKELKNVANYFWNSYPDISGQNEWVQNRTVAGAVDSVARGTAVYKTKSKSQLIMEALDEGITEGRGNNEKGMRRAFQEAYYLGSDLVQVSVQGASLLTKNYAGTGVYQF